MYEERTINDIVKWQLVDIVLMVIMIVIKCMLQHKIAIAINSVNDDDDAPI